MFKKVIWPLMMVTSALMMLVFVVGFIRVMTITYGDDSFKLNKNTNYQDKDNILTEEANLSIDSSNEKRQILIIGDSIGVGVGDERNLGIGQRYINQLDFEEGDLYDVLNFSVSGAKTDDLSKVLLSGSIDKGIQAADIIVISIGGNDLKGIRNSDTTLQIINFQESLGNHLDDFNDVLSGIRVLNPSVVIAVLGLYNPYDDVNKEDIRLVQEWNYQTRLSLIEYDHTNMIPLYDVFKRNLDKLLSIDQFHPSGEGYELIAEMLHKVLKNKY